MLDAHFWGAVIVSVGLLVAVMHILRLVQVGMTHRTLRRALEAGLTVSTEQVDRALGQGSDEARRALDRRNGWVLVALAAATVGFGALQASQDMLRLAAGVSLFPLFIGIVMIVLARRPATQS